MTRAELAVWCWGNQHLFKVEAITDELLDELEKLGAESEKARPEGPPTGSRSEDTPPVTHGSAPDPFLNLPLADPIPRQNVLDGLIHHLRKLPPREWGLDTGAAHAYLFLMQPGAPCGHARAFFFQTERGETGCMACDMWDDRFCK